MTTTWQQLANTITPRTGLLIEGRFRSATESFEVIAPRNGQLITEIAFAGTEDVDAAVASARRAFEDGRWSKRAPRERKAVLMAWAALCQANADELALLMALEMGKPAHEAKSIEVRAVANTLAWFGEACDKILDEIPHTARDALALITREPAGVVGAVVPWNFPLTMAAWKVAPALAAGCSVVLKPAENSPLSALRFAELGLEAGLPEGVFNVVNGHGHLAGRALGEHPDVDVLTFTGSTEVGRYFLDYAAKSNLKRVYLELGGKSANIIFPDADLDKAASTAAWSIFFNQGEMCTAGSRLLVHESIHDEVVARVSAIAHAMQPADPLSDDAPMGALVSKEHLERVETMVDTGAKDRAELIVGGERVNADSGGYYFPPTIFDHVAPDAYIAQEEVFGPVLSVSTFKDDAEALSIANGTRYGLASAVWTQNLDRAVAISRGLRVGVCWVNCYEEGDMTIPFGGVKESGFGRDKSLHALEKFFDLKSTWIQLSEPS